MKYRTIVVDPPWPIGDFPAWHAEDRRSERERTLGYNPTPYPVMSLDEIKALPVRDLSDNVDSDTHLYLWTIDQFLEDAFKIARAWGFHHAATLVWCKAEMGGGLGGTWPNNVEFVLFCRRPKVTNKPEVVKVTSFLAEAAHRAGISAKAIDEAMGTRRMAQVWWITRTEHRCACPTNEQWTRLKDLLGFGDEMDALVQELNARKGTVIPAPLRRAPGRWFQWKRGKHSAKPEAFIDMVEQVSPPPYVELFARRHRLGWDVHGFESANTATLESVS